MPDHDNIGYKRPPRIGNFRRENPETRKGVQRIRVTSRRIWPGNSLPNRHHSAWKSGLSNEAEGFDHGLITRAIKGDTRAAKVILNLSGSCLRPTRSSTTQ